MGGGASSDRPAAVWEGALRSYLCSVTLNQLPNGSLMMLSTP
jgi:hypothetical protein